MPQTILRFDDTPNPNAIKFTLSAAVTDAPRAFRTAADAEDHPLASALFAVNGVTNLYLCNDWFTVNKAPDARWSAVRKGVERAVKDVQ